MNVLIFSPYKSLHSIGRYATYLIDNCFGNENDVNLTVKNITIDTTTNNDVSNIDKYSEVYSKYDYIIHHCRYEYINYIPGAKNVWIPIIHNLSNIQDPYLNEYLKNIDLICTENKFTEMVLARSIDCVDKIKRFEFEISDSNKQEVPKINFNKYNSSHKYYTILDFNVDQLCLLNLIKNFAAIFRNNDDHLLSILTSCSQEQYEQINTLLKELAVELNLNKDISNIRIYSTQNISIQDTIPLHDSCDTFLDIEHNTENIHKYLAKLYGSNIVDKIDTDFSDSYGYRNGSCFDYKNQTYAMVSDSFEKIFNITKTKTYNTESNLMEILRAQ